jgi:hypothetical protein
VGSARRAHALSAAGAASQPAPDQVLLTDERSGALPGVAGMIAVAKHVYGNEINGGRVHSDVRFIADDQALLRELSRRELGAAQAEAYRRMTSNRTKHITRVSVLRGRRMLVNAVWNSNGSFVVAPLQEALYSRRRSLGTLLVSVQDVVGYVRLVHLYTGAQVVVRGTSGQVRASLAAAAKAVLPSSGHATVAGQRYVVGSFPLRAWGSERLTVWLLEPA